MTQPTGKVLRRYTRGIQRCDSPAINLPRYCSGTKQRILCGCIRLEWMPQASSPPPSLTRLLLPLTSSPSPPSFLSDNKRSHQTPHRFFVNSKAYKQPKQPLVTLESFPHPLATQRDTTQSSVAFLPYQFTKPFSQGHPDKLEFMSIENLKTYGTSLLPQTCLYFPLCARSLQRVVAAPPLVLADGGLCLPSHRRACRSVHLGYLCIDRAI